MSILKFLENKNRITLFTTPTHGQKTPHLRWLSGLYKHDYSEVNGFDNLADPACAILMIQNITSEIYKTRKTFFLTQGSTLGILAVFKALLKENDRVLVARNCHKSVFSALSMTGASLDWVIPEVKEEWGIYGEINPKKLEDNLKLNSYKAFVLTSPTYEGVNSDIKKISNICRQYGVYLIVDEAHGSLYNFSKRLPKSAVGQGADFSVNSLHKNAGAPNPCALLHVGKNCADFDMQKLQDALNLFTTSSPSYPMLAAIEATIDFLNKKGEGEIEKLIKNIESIKKPLKHAGWQFLDADPTKIVLKKEGVDAKLLSEILYENFQIEDELANNISLLFLCGIGTTKSKLTKLKDVLLYVKMPPQEVAPQDFQPYPFIKVQPKAAWEMDYAFVEKEDALLKVSAQMIAQCPPGYAVLYPGEVIQEWHLNYLENKVKVLKHE